MRLIKSNIKLLIGILALALAVSVFFIAMKSQSNLEEKTLNSWLSASDTRRMAAVEILTGTSENSELMISCISKMASMPDTGKVKVRDAASLCAAGIALRNNEN